MNITLTGDNKMWGAKHVTVPLKILWSGVIFRLLNLFQPGISIRSGSSGKLLSFRSIYRKVRLFKSKWNKVRKICFISSKLYVPSFKPNCAWTSDFTFFNNFQLKIPIFSIQSSLLKVQFFSQFTSRIHTFRFLAIVRYNILDLNFGFQVCN